MNEEEILGQTAKLLQNQGFEVTLRPSPKDKDNQVDLFATIDNTLVAFEVLSGSETMKFQAAASTFRLSKIKDRLDASNLLIDLEQVFLIAFDPDPRTLSQLEQMRHDLSISRRRVIVLGDLKRKDFEARLNEEISRFSRLATKGTNLEVVPPLERLRTEMKDARSQELVVAYRDGGLAGLKKKVADLSGEAG